MVKEEGVAEAPGAGPQHLQLKIKSQDGDSIEFRVKPTTKFEKLTGMIVQIFTVYCQKKGYEANSVRFLFDGVHLQPHQQVSEAEMEDGDQIDCLITQLGGYSLGNISHMSLC